MSDFKDMLKPLNDMCKQKYNNNSHPIWKYLNSTTN